MRSFYNAIGLSISIAGTVRGIREPYVFRYASKLVAVWVNDAAGMRIFNTDAVSMLYSD